MENLCQQLFLELRGNNILFQIEIYMRRKEKEVKEDFLLKIRMLNVIKLIVTDLGNS